MTFRKIFWKIIENMCYTKYNIRLPYNILLYYQHNADYYVQWKFNERYMIVNYYFIGFACKYHNKACQYMNMVLNSSYFWPKCSKYCSVSIYICLFFFFFFGAWLFTFIMWKIMSWTFFINSPFVFHWRRTVIQACILLLCELF